MKITREDLRQRLLPIVLTQLISLGCGVAGIRLTSHLIDPTDFGIYSIFLTLVSIGPTVIFAGLVKFVGRHWQESSDQPALARAVLTATLRKLPWLLAASIAGTIASYTTENLWFGVTLFVSAYLLSLTQIAQAALQASRAHWHDLSIAAGASITRSFIPALWYAASGAGLRALFLGFFAHAFFGFGLSALSAKRWRRLATAEPTVITVSPEFSGASFVLIATLAWALFALNRWVAAWSFGSETAGFFALATNIGVILPIMLSAVFQQFLLPSWFAAPHATQDDRRALLRRADRTVLAYVGVGLVASYTVHLLVPYLVGPLVGEAYRPALRFVLATGFFAVAASTGSLYQLMLLAAKRESACLRTDLSGGLCLITVSVISAQFDINWFIRWMLVAPVVPWILNRSVARKALLAEK